MELELLQLTPDGTSQPSSNPLLFVHGAWHAAWCWEENFMPFFAGQGYSCYALSFRGHGASQGRNHLRRFGLNDYVADVRQVAEKLPAPPVLIGHSTGGMVVQHYLGRYPQSIAGAVLLAPVPISGGLASAMRLCFRHPLAFIKSQLTLSMYPLIAKPKLAQDALFSAQIGQEKLLKYFSRLQDESYRVNLELVYRLPKPKATQIPLLVLGARGDRMFTMKEIETTARAWGVEAEIFPGLAHDIMLEEGWQVVARRILQWLNSEIKQTSSGLIQNAPHAI